MDDVVSFRIPRDLKRRMDRMKVNWSDRLREFVQDALRTETNRRILARIDRITGRYPQPKVGTAAKLIREIRDRA